MSLVRRFDHVGITVSDLNTVTAFFVGLGLEVEGTRMFVEGEFLDTVIGIPDSRTEIVMLRPPDGSTWLELLSFVRPAHRPGSPAAMANELGLRNVAFEVDDLRRPSTCWRRTATGWSATSASTSTSGAWPTCASGGDHRVPRRADRLTWLQSRARFTGDTRLRLRRDGPRRLGSGPGFARRPMTSWPSWRPARSWKWPSRKGIDK